MSTDRPPSAQLGEMQQRIPFVTVTNWVRAARLCGIDIEAAFRREGIDTRLLHPETTTIDRATIQRVMHQCVAETRRIGSPRHFPLVLGETFAFEYLSDVETFITTSATLREATRSLEWIPPLINPFMRFSVAEHGDDARIALRFDVSDDDADIGALRRFVWKPTATIAGGGGAVWACGQVALAACPHAHAALLGMSWRLSHECWS